MSGGYFDYKQYEIDTIADSINQLIKNNVSREIDSFGDEIGRKYPVDIIEKFKLTVKTLRLAAVMAQRVDWLVSGDDGEDSFRARWKEEMDILQSNKKLESEC